MHKQAEISKTHGYFMPTELEEGLQCFALRLQHPPELS